MDAPKIEYLFMNEENENLSHAHTHTHKKKNGGNPKEC